MGRERAAAPSSTSGAGPQVPNATKFPQGMYDTLWHRALGNFPHALPFAAASIR